MYPSTGSDAECVSESNAHVSWSLGRILLLQSAVCGSRAVLSSKSTRASEELKALTITLETFAPSPISKDVYLELPTFFAIVATPVSASQHVDYRHLLSYTTFQVRDGDVVHRGKTSSCRLLAVRQRVPPGSSFFHQAARVRHPAHSRAWPFSVA